MKLRRLIFWMAVVVLCLAGGGFYFYQHFAERFI